MTDNSVEAIIKEIKQCSERRVTQQPRRQATRDQVDRRRSNYELARELIIDAKYLLPPIEEAIIINDQLDALESIRK